MSDDKLEQTKMDRRKKRTSSSQYMMYIEMMENDNIFATGRIPRDGDANYLVKKWKELSDKLNTCSSGPRLTAEEWRKRLNDWKNTTRCKYRRSVSGEKDVTMTPLELKALDLFGKVPSVNMPPEQISIKLKQEKDDDDDQQQTSEIFQKELQAAVEEAIGGDDDEDPPSDLDDDEVMPHSPTNVLTTTNTSSGSQSNTANFRTIVVESNSYADEDNNNNDGVEYVTQRRHTTTGTAAAAVQTVVTATPTTVTKLINGEIPLKRLRTQAPEIIYEVKKAPLNQLHATQLSGPRNITIHNSVPSVSHQTHINASESRNSPLFSSADAREISRQIKRLADLKSEKLRFEIARFKFKNPGFHFNTAPL